ncbi:long-chain fatty acid--CoA ligase [Tessaracoccus rhinocerotis]|uniref:Long-chain fatty acid--CoA ligase n=1 Tax=Tessaracoccus rhinocerotis TaxID=1689449 RepID=A0A553K4V2_9ACTN|nr:long-chain fatty acid--CoA ligase [Tessaracoccus rhinocerotis]TRY19721.1 long-chain fatty acid--CoA ligase [Tessaracoccus rhinocerotis]
MTLQNELLGFAKSVGEMFNNRVAETPQRVAFMEPDRAGNGNWTKYTWAQTKDEVDAIAAGLLARGLTHEQRVAIISGTRLEWIHVDLAISCAAGATTTVYPNTAAGDVDYILKDSGSVVVVAEDAEQAAKVDEDPEVSAQVHTIVVFDTDGVDLDERTISLAQLKEAGRALLAENPSAVDDAIASTDHDTLSTLIYTSGTTGRPKGVCLTHASWVYEGAATKSWDLLSPDDLQYLWLPLSHVFGKALIAVQLAYGFASAVDGRLDQIVPGLGAVKPTFMCGAPRIFEKVRAAVLTGNTGLKAKIARWAFATGRKSHPYRLAGKELPGLLKFQYNLADKLVFSKLKEKLGGRLRFMISGSAKLSPQVQEWFYSAGILIVEGYGATETSAIAFLNLPTDPLFGSVGQVLPGCEAKIADDGEVLIRGPIITTGYHNRPEKTAEVIDDEGWYATGDIGQLDSQGNLRITDRKKDLFKTSGGKYVAPQKVEGAITANIPYISQAVAVGDGHKYVSALVVMDPVLLQKWAEKRQLTHLSYAELTQLPDIRDSIERQMENVNSRLERWETVKKFAILDHELTVDNDSVTANQKIRRKLVIENNAELVEGMYPQED